MLQITRRLALAAALLAVSGASACRTADPYDMGTPSNNVSLVVRNDNFLDVDVYAVADGLATRIGTVNGNNTARFGLNDSLWGASDLRIVAAPIGGNGRASSGSLIVHGGQTIMFTVAAVLRQSNATVR